LYTDKVGGSMRLGAYECNLAKDSLAQKAYAKVKINERHRHRYEFNNSYRDALQTAGMAISGTSLDGLLVEVVEFPANDFYIGVQFHPEFKSRPNKPHPLFKEFISAAGNHIR